MHGSTRKTTVIQCSKQMNSEIGDKGKRTKRNARTIERRGKQRLKRRINHCTFVWLYGTFKLLAFMILTNSLPDYASNYISYILFKVLCRRSANIGQKNSPMYIDFI